MGDNIKSIHNEEIDLRELIHIIINDKWIILSITLVSVLIGVVLSFFVIKPVYESTAVVAPASVSNISGANNFSMIINSSEGKTLFDSSKVSNNLDQIVKLNQVDVSGFKAILTSNTTLDNTIKKLGLNNNIEKIKSQITVEQNKEDINTNKTTVQITVYNNNPQTAALIANTLISEAIVNLNEINNENINELVQNLDVQLKTAQQDLATAYNDLKEYRIHNINNYSSIENEIEERKLENEVKRRQAIVDSLGIKILEVKVAKSLIVAENNIVILSPALPSDNPVSPKKVLILAIAVMLGLIISVCVVFFKNYINKVF